MALFGIVKGSALGADWSPEYHLSCRAEVEALHKAKQQLEQAMYAYRAAIMNLAIRQNRLAWLRRHNVVQNPV